MKYEFFQKIFEKYSNIIKICPVGAELFHADGWRDGQTDRHDEANSHFSRFCEHALK